MNPKQTEHENIQVKRCPRCNRVEFDETLKFCRVDGASLVAAPLTESESATMTLVRSPQTQEITTSLKRQETTTGRLPTIKSIAVLPFANISAEAENEFFCDGLAEELLNALAKVDGLKVTARTSSFSFKGKQVNVDQIGQTLRVNTILEGSVRRAGTRLRITVQLINAADSYQLWSERYDRELKDIFDVQDEITLAVVAALKVKLLGDAQEAVLKRGTDDPASYELYLRGRFYWNKRTGAALNKAIELFRQAVAKDPNFALAYVGIADCFTQIALYLGVHTTETLPYARAAAEQALQLDDTLAEAHASMGQVHFRDLKWEQAEQAYQRAICLNPNYPTAHHWYSEYFRVLRRRNEELREIKRAMDLDPLSPLICTLVGEAYRGAGDVAGAVSEWQRVIELEPNFPLSHFFLGGIYAEQQRFDEAIAESEKAVALSGRGGLFLGALGRSYALAGQELEAMAILAELEQRYAENTASGFNLAHVYIGLRDIEQVLKWLERDFETGNTGGLVLVTFRDFYDLLRDDARYQDLLRRMGMRIAE
jgi:adenylate cyclase